MSIYEGEDISMKIREMLKERKMTVQELSQKTKINCHTLQKYYSGARNITVGNAKKIGEILKFDWWLLFEKKEDKNDKHKT